MAQKIQPIVFLGCWEATRAPTAANDTNSRYAQISASSGLRLIPVGVGEFRNLNNAHTMTNVSERAHSDQASQLVGRFIPPIARLFSLATLVTTLLYRITVSQTLQQRLSILEAKCSRGIGRSPDLLGNFFPINSGLMLMTAGQRSP
jgi:hypothetical protein